MTSVLVRLVVALRQTRVSWLVVAAIALASAVPASRVIARQVTPRFSHDQHAKFFPQCSGCHQGVRVGTAAATFPDTAVCGQCHNNRDSEKVAWTAPTRTPSNLKFAHKDHVSKTDDGNACAACHAPADAKWMHVERTAPKTCLECHADDTKPHLGPTSKCADCHVTLPQAKALPASRISVFPRPPSHEASDFLQKHDVKTPLAQAQCAVCHARESCARCHVNATRIASRFTLEPDARIAGIVAVKLPVYSVPVSHRASGFAELHGPIAREAVLSCANCHAQASCRACHIGQSAADVITQLPNAEPGSAPGVQITTGGVPWNRATASSTPITRIALGPATRGRQTAPGLQPRKAQVHPAGFAKAHGASAASSQLTCAGCHTRSYCADCHGGESKRRFHVANFVARHAPEAWGRDTDCQQCHNPEVFCRSCHTQVGLSAKGRSNVGYHSAVPLWALQHGQAARQGLQSCTSCHTQRDCMQCHAQTGRGINPHGADFDARRLWKANRLTCLRCHLRDPFEGR